MAVKFERPHWVSDFLKDCDLEAISLDALSWPSLMSDDILEEDRIEMATEIQTRVPNLHTLLGVRDAQGEINAIVEQLEIVRRFKKIELLGVDLERPKTYLLQFPKTPEENCIVVVTAVLPDGSLLVTRADGEMIKKRWKNREVSPLSLSTI